MALDRQSIEKKDFPVGRRGYDPTAVDAHLSSLADEIAELKRTSRRRTDSLASSASDQVRAIVEAAEASASDIQRDAETEAKEIRDEATSEAKATRENAAKSAREYVGKVSESTGSMIERLATMQAELDKLMETLRNGSGQLSSDLKLLETNLQDVHDVVMPSPGFEPEAPGTSSSAAPASAAPTKAPDTTAAPASSAAATSTSEAESGSAGNGRGEDDLEGARLIALNMALNGTPREETSRYLSQNFKLSDVDGLLDEVYASVES